MAVSTLDAVSFFVLFGNLVPFFFYLATSIVCGLKGKWISVAFSAALCLVLFIWIFLSVVAMISTLVLSKRRAAATKKVIAVPLPPISSAAATSTHNVPMNLELLRVGSTSTPAPGSVTDDPPVFEEANPATVLSSISEATVVDLRQTTSGSFVSLRSDRRQGKGETINPLVTSYTSRPQTKESPRRSPRGSSLQMVTSTNTKPGSRQLGSDDAAGVVAGASGAAGAGEEDVATSAVLITPNADPDGSEDLKGYSADKLGSDSPVNLQSSKLQQHFSQNAIFMHADIYGGNELTKAPHTPKVVSASRHRLTSSNRLSVASTKIAISIPNPSLSMSAAFMMPVVSIYATIALVVLQLAGSFMIEYDTHSLFFCLPALASPCHLAMLDPLVEYFSRTSASHSSFHAKLLHCMLHKVTLFLVGSAAVAIYVVALALQTTKWSPYDGTETVVPVPIRVVGYTSPLVLFSLLCSVVLRTLVVRRSSPTTRAHKGSGPIYQYSVGRAAAEAARSTQQRSRSISPRSCSASNLIPSSSFRATQKPHASLSTTPLLSDDSASTLSSIVRSSVMSSVFIPPNSLASPTRLSVSKSLLRGSQSSSTSMAQPVMQAAHLTSVPQLKTVTILYIAYRNIYDGADDMVSPAVRFDAKGSLSESRDRQQIIATNFEALVEALEDTNDGASSDANAFILTAYAEALCLVWGLMPFSSDPVLLAIEKAQRVMAAFRSRPVPSSSFSNGQQELVAAVVSAPHSLVGLVGTELYRGVHFFNPHQHDTGSLLLQRGLQMYRRLPSVQSADANSGVPFQCILLDGGSWRSAASHILARPCGLAAEPSAKSPQQMTVKSPPVGMTAKKKPVKQFVFMYNFIELVQAKEEEWHLVVQRQERLGERFGFLTEAAQLIQQGDTGSAHEVLEAAVKTSNTSNDVDSIALAQMLLEDLDQLENKAS